LAHPEGIYAVVNKYCASNRKDPFPPRRIRWGEQDDIIVFLGDLRVLCGKNTTKRLNIRRIMTALKESAEIALRDCMALNESETLLVVSDDKTFEIGTALFEVGKNLAKDSFLMVMTERDVNGQEPPEAISDLMTKYDVVICPTAKSLTHTDARRNACKAGARVGTMPGITNEVMIRTLKANYHKIAERTHRLTGKLDTANKVHISTEKGTDIIIPINGIKAISSTGLVTTKGSYGNLPSGESYLMPVEGKTSGVFVVDGSFAAVGKIEEMPITITAKDGFATRIEGGNEASRLNDMLEPMGHAAYNIAELGIGTNDQAIVTGAILEDEKVMGTVHIALGNNISMGGTCDVGIHLDGVILEPTVTVDGNLIMEKGKLKIEE
jgi:leucyl aminopeptidase (aminopeptidase T)